MTNAPVEVFVDAVDEVKVTVPPMKALPVIPTPPLTDKEPVVVEVLLVPKDKAIPLPVYTKLLNPVTAVPVAL